MLSANPQQKTINRLKENSALSMVTPLIEASLNVGSALIVSKKYIHRSLLGKPQSKCVFNIFQNVGQHAGRASGQS